MRSKRSLAAGLVLAALAAVPSAGGAPELSLSNRLKDRRYVAAGERARVIGFEDGRFYANGWHIAGEMGGVWTSRSSSSTASGSGSTTSGSGRRTSSRSGGATRGWSCRTTAGCSSSRTDFAPDGHRAALFGLSSRTRGERPTVTVKVDAHSELLDEYPWSFDDAPNASDHSRTRPRSTTTRSCSATRASSAPERAGHDYAALVARTATPVAGETGASAERVPGTAGHARLRRPGAASACDDGPFGRGKGGQLRYEVTVPAGGWRGSGSRSPGRTRARRRRARSSRPRCDDPPRSSRRRSPTGSAAGANAAVVARRPAARAGAWTGASRTSSTSPRRRGPPDPLAQPGQGVPAAARALSPRPLGRRRLPGLPVDVRHRRRVHGVRERRPRPVRADQGPPARPARRLGDPERPARAWCARGVLRGLGLVRQTRAHRPGTASGSTSSTPTRRSSSRAPSR